MPHLGPPRGLRGEACTNDTATMTSKGVEMSKKTSGGKADAKGDEEWEAEGSSHQKSEIRNSKSDIFSFYMPEIRATVSVPSVRRVLSV